MNWLSLEAFWQSTMERARLMPLEVTAQAVDGHTPYSVYKLTYNSFGGIPVRAYLSLPVNGAEGGSPARRLPAIVTAPGYGGWEFGTTLSECQRGYAVLQVYPRSQGESAELWRVDNDAYQAWINHGRNEPEGFYYQGAYLDLVRAMDYLRTRSDIDPDRIGLMGTSQGGLLALGTAAIEPRVAAVVAHVPYLCDLRHSPAIFGSEPANKERFLSLWSYFDPARLAPRIGAPTLLSAGGRDATCPPATIRAVFDALTGIKCLAFYPSLTHTSCNDFYAMSWQWMQRYLA